jgi:hypothetical protein
MTSQPSPYSVESGDSTSEPTSPVSESPPRSSPLSTDEKSSPPASPERPSTPTSESSEPKSSGTRGREASSRPKAAKETADALRKSNLSLGRDSETYLAVEQTSSSEGSPAKTSPSPGNEKDSEGDAPASTGRSSDSFETLALFGLEHSSSKMSPASFPLAAVADAESAERFYDGIANEAVRELQKATASQSEATSPSRSGSASPATPLGGSGSGTPEPTSPWSSPRWGTSGIASATEYSTADTSESPRDGGASSSSLSSILEREVERRYYLSPKAALGILSRAGRRGRELPEHLLLALEAVVAQDPKLWAAYREDPQVRTPTLT